MSTYLPIADGIAPCLHPNQTSTARQPVPRRARELRKVGPRHWALRTFMVHGRPILDVRCPDCPARAVYITEPTAVRIDAWLLRDEPSTMETL